MTDPILQGFVQLAWICGYLPVNSPQLASPHFQRPWNLPMTLYSVLWLAFTVSLTVNFFWSIQQMGQYYTLAWFIMFVTSSVSDSVLTIGSRLVGLVYCSQFTQLIQDLFFVQRYNDIWLARLKCPQSRWRRWASRLKFYIPLFILIIISVYTFIKVEISYWNYREADLMVIVSKFYPSQSRFWKLFPMMGSLANGFFCRVVTAGFVITLGVLLLTTWRGLFETFESEFQWENKMLVFQKANDISTKGGGNKVGVEGEFGFSIPEFTEAYHRLQSALGFYGEFMGCMALVSLFDAGVQVAYTIYETLWPRDQVTSSPSLIYAVGYFLLLVFTGNALESQIKITRDRVDECLLMERITNARPQSGLVYVAKAIVAWKWNFTAKDIFVVNNSLIPAFLGTLVTCMTFIIQLDLSELANKKAGNGSIAVPPTNRT